MSFVFCDKMIDYESVLIIFISLSEFTMIYIYIFHHQVATNTLERVAPLTHAVGNVLKRVFVIGFSIIVFGKYLFLPCYVIFIYLSLLAFKKNSSSLDSKHSN